MGQLPHAPVILAGAFSSAVTRCGEVMSMRSKAVVSLTTGLEDPEKVTVAFLVAVAAAEQRRPTLMFLTKEAARLAAAGVIQGVACEGCPPLPELAKRYREAGGRFLVCPICFNAGHEPARPGGPSWRPGRPGRGCARLPRLGPPRRANGRWCTATSRR